MAKEIRTRQVCKDIKALDKAKAVTGHMKHAYIRTKESAGQAQMQSQESETPADYAENRMACGADRVIHEAVHPVRQQGRKKKNQRKEIRQTVEIIKQENGEGHTSGKEPCPSFSSAQEGKSYQTKSQGAKNKNAQAGQQPLQQRQTQRQAIQQAGQRKAQEQTIWRESQQKAVQRTSQQRVSEIGRIQVRKLPKQTIKTLEHREKTIKTNHYSRRAIKPVRKGAVKGTGKSIKTAEQTAKTTVKTSQKAAKTAQKTARTSAKMAEKAVRAAKQAARAAGETVKVAAKAAAASAKAAVAATKAFIAALAAGGWAAALILIVILLFGAVFHMTGGDNLSTVNPVSAEVEAYRPVIQKYADQYGIGEYAELLMAVMMQESGGRGNDPMQSSQCPYNKKYPRKPNGIKEPEYSIACGVQALKAELTEAEAESPIDMERIKLALQGYNYGNGYIKWAKNNYGGYTAAGAVEFSEMMAKKMGWKSYGDKQYVPHVLQYYAFGRIPAGTGNQAIVQVALTQEGNSGDTYWSWYGFGSRVEWCACFVSWCGEQCGYLESGAIPKFSLCSDGARWFQTKGQFQDGSSVPAAGDIIFFDWKNDGTIDHVGIVENVADGVVHTVEGNSKDKVARRSYPLGDRRIYGYGCPVF